ncbi:MAG: VWA domain-containing protein, partial [Pseudomonadota bacterium]
NFGSENYFKGEVLTHLSALLGFSAAKNNDNVGLLLFSDQVEHFVPPKKGRGHIQRILRDLYYHEPKSKQTNISAVVEYLSGVLKKRGTVFLFSDFMDPSPFATSLKRLSRRHETIAVQIMDPIEENIPSIGMIDFIDPETGELLTMDTSSPIFRRYYTKEINEYREAVSSELKKSRVDLVEITNGEDFVQPLANYFKKRKG